MEQKPQIVISKMTENDVPFVALLEKECFSSPWSERSLLESLENEGSVFLCASIGGKDSLFSVRCVQCRKGDVCVVEGACKLQSKRFFTQ